MEKEEEQVVLEKGFKLRSLKLNYKFIAHANLRLK
jgi:hypothetical protein